MGDPVDSDHKSYRNVLHRKLSGSLTVTVHELGFRPTNAANNAASSVPWNTVTKHQVSPVSYPKPLLKLILRNGTSLTFQMSNRQDLNTIRNEITGRLHSPGTSSATIDTAEASKKQNLSQLVTDGASTQSNTTFDDLDPTVLAVTRSAVLAANPALRKQHSYLVRDTQTVDESDFWETHRSLLEEEYACIAGVARTGTPSLLVSHLPNAGRILLGVEEMRQIFILYPAVHKAYEEKVPLELSDEQFWRKFLESEYFHRDRGRIGAMARDHAGPAAVEGRRPTKSAGPSLEDQEARAAAVGTDDLFSRYDQKLREQQASVTSAGEKRRRIVGRQLACGQFDLASTFETERGHLLEPKDYFPQNQADDGKGARVIQKYNRHWAMVLHPQDAIAGSDLQKVARKSVQEVLPGDEDADAGGGLDKEMRRLVDLASARAEGAAPSASHGEYEKLTLSNIEAYHSNVRAGDGVGTEPAESEDDAAARHVAFAQALAVQMEALARASDKVRGLPPSCFPPPALALELLSALTKKMVQDARTEEASLEVVRSLPEDFRSNLQTYFRRSSELLRHFYGLRKLEGQQPRPPQSSAPHGAKLARIVRAMETFYREMEAMRKQLPQTETGEVMRKMCLPIMDQLDWAFKLHREGSGGGGGGGFVTVER